MENLIHRAVTALIIGVSEDEIINNLLKSGNSKEDVYLAIQAAKVLGKEDKNDQTNDSQ